MCGHIGEQPSCLSTSGDIGSYGAMENSPANNSGDSQPQLSKLRLFVVVYKVCTRFLNRRPCLTHSSVSCLEQGVTEDMLARLFRRFPGMEYCDLKKDRRTNKSKVSGCF